MVTMSGKAIIFIGFLMNAALAGETLPSDFFINPETGNSSIIIVIGSSAASLDVVSATMLSTAIGARASDEESRTVHQNILFSNVQIDPQYRIGFPTIDVPYSQSYSEWEHNDTPINYPLSLWYLDSPFWSNPDGSFEPWETHEEIQVRFDGCNAVTNKRWTASLKGDINGWNIKVDNSSWYKVPGFIYRIDNIFVPPSIIVEGVTAPYPPIGRRYPELPMPEPWLIVHDMLPQFRLFNTLYTVVEGGAVMDMNSRTGKEGPLYGTPYLVTGNPHFANNVRLYVGKPMKFGTYTIECTLTSSDAFSEWAFLDIYQDGDLLDSFTMNLSPKDGFPLDLQNEKFPFDVYKKLKDVNGNGYVDPGEMTNIISSDEFVDSSLNVWVVGRAKGRIWIDFEWKYYEDDKGDVWFLFPILHFAVDGVRLFRDEWGPGVEIQVYWLENEKFWYNSDSLCDPWSGEPQYRLFLDVYESGWDTLEGNSYKYQPPGTGLWPPLGLNMCGNSLVVGNGFLDFNDGHTGYEYLPGYFLEQHDLDRDSGQSNDCRNSDGSLQTECTNHNDMEDPVMWHGPGIILVEMNISLYQDVKAPGATWIIPGPHFEEPCFFVHVTDTWFQGKNPGITYETVKVNIRDSKISNIDETCLVMYDSEFDFDAWKTDGNCNVILIGGHKANAVVNQLVQEGVSVINWATSNGEWEYIEAPYNGCDILIIAGKDRESTSVAVQRLIRKLQSGNQL